MANAVCRLPVLLQRVYTNLSCGRYIRMEYLRGKPAFWRSSGELFCKFEFHTEVSSSIRCTLWPLNYSSNIEHIFFVGNDPNAFWWVALQFCKLAHQAAHIWRNRHFGRRGFERVFLKFFKQANERVVG